MGPGSGVVQWVRRRRRRQGGDKMRPKVGRGSESVRAGTELGFEAFVIGTDKNVPVG